MSEETALPQQVPELNEKHVESLMFLVERVLGETSPSLWDTRGWDLALLDKNRWAADLPNQALSEAFNRCLEKERITNTRNWRVYKQNGGRHKGLDTTGQPLPTDLEEEDLEAETKLKSSQNQDFVTGGTMSGDQIILHTLYGQVITNVEHILSFRLFQQDVLRYTKTVYPSRFKKLHERNVTKWLEAVTFASEDTKDDDSLPVNLFRNLFPGFIEMAETEPERQERALRQKAYPILENNELLFTMATLIEWLRKNDPDHRFKRGELKTFLKESYGTRFTDTVRKFNLRCCRVILTDGDVGFVPPAPKPTTDTVSTENTEHSETDQQEVQHDSGSGEDDPAHHGHHEPREPRLPPPEYDDPVVLQNNRGGSEGTPESEALPF